MMFRSTIERHLFSRLVISCRESSTVQVVETYGLPTLELL